MWVANRRGRAYRSGETTWALAGRQADSDGDHERYEQGHGIELDDRIDAEACNSYTIASPTNEILRSRALDESGRAVRRMMR